MNNTVPLFALLISVLAWLPFCCAHAQALPAAYPESLVREALAARNLTITGRLEYLGLSMTDPNVLYVSYDGYLATTPITTLAYNIATNQILWVAPITTITEGSFVVTPTLIVTVALQVPSLIVAQDVKSGKIVWSVSIPTPGDAARGAARINGTVIPAIYLVDSGLTVFCFREIDGKLLWQYDESQHVYQEVKTDPSLAVDGVFLFNKHQVVHIDGTGYIITLKEFKEEIVILDFDQITDFRILVDSGVVYDISANYSVVGHIDIPVGDYRGYLKFVPTDQRLAIIFTCSNFTTCHLIKYDIVDEKAIWDQIITVTGDSRKWYLPVIIGADGKLYYKDVSANSNGDVVVADFESGKTLGKLPSHNANIFAATKSGVVILPDHVAKNTTVIYFESL